MKPLVSILIPAYNAEKWIADTIQSALAQTWPNKEIIIVDDGSTDQTLSVARQFASKTVIVVTQANQGAAATRNHAFSFCKGDYVQWLDADDLLSSSKIERQMEALEHGGSNRTLLSSEWGRFMYRCHRADFSPTPLYCDLSPAEWLIRKMNHNLHMQTATWLVSRELTQAAGPWNTRLRVDDDGEYFCRVILASNGVRFVPGARVYYRMTGFNSLSYIGCSKAKMAAQFESMKLHIGYLQSLEDSERSRAACVKYLQNWLPYFYPERTDLFKQAEDVAAALGGRLEVPRLSWKYAWVKTLFGWRVTKRVQFRYNQVKWAILRAWDKILYEWEGQKPGHSNIQEDAIEVKQL